MDDKYLSSGEVCQIADLPANTLDEWARKGVVSPVEGGEGHGSHRRFTVMQSVGVTIATAIRNSERGCAPTYVSKVIQAFAEAKPEWLKKQFAEGKTHLATIHQGRPILSGKQFDWVDVERVYRDVLKQIDNLAAAPSNTSGRGRRRGLSG